MTQTEASRRHANSVELAKCGTNCLQQSSCHARTGGRQDRLRVVLRAAETGASLPTSDINTGSWILPFRYCRTAEFSRYLLGRAWQAQQCKLA